MTQQPTHPGPYGQPGFPAPYPPHLPGASSAAPAYAEMPAPAAAKVLRFDTQADTPQVVNTVIPFVLDDDEEVLYAQRPKDWVLLQIAAGADSEDIGELARVVMLFVSKCFDADSRVYIEKRLDDDDDTLDLRGIVPVLRQLLTMWGDASTGPTGGPAGAPVSPSLTGPRSTVRAPSRGSTP